MIQWQPVTSTNISEAGYDLERQLMAIRFKKGGVYQATNVPADEFTNLMQSGSPGGYFHRVLKGAYNWVKV